MEPKTARRGRERGQVLVLFTLMLGVLLGFVAMSVDVGMILHERRSLQNAADAAALAGVQELPASPTTAVAKSMEWAEKNGYTPENGATVTVNTPYGGNLGAVEVVIEVEEPFIFARALGLDTVDVSARAVASRDPGFGYAVFAYDSGCGNSNEVDISGSDVNISGGMHSNGDLKTTGGDTDVEGPITALCEPQISGGEVTATSGVTKVNGARDWPVIYDYGDFGPCTFNTSGDMVITNLTTQYWVNNDPNTGKLKPGVYCSQGEISLNKASSGNVTFVAKKQISFVGSGYDLKAYQNNVVAYTSYDSGGANKDAVKISSNDFKWKGLLLAPNGRVQIASSKVKSESGAIIAKTVKVSASSVDITGIKFKDDGPPKLVE